MKVLIIEDEQRIARYIKKGLQTKAYVVDMAFDGIQGFDLASTENYDVIILDRMLPGMDGLELCRKLRKEGNNTPILILTAKTQVDEKVEGLEAGADDYLAKPFAFVELLARIKALARRPKSKIDNILKVGSLTLNTNTYEVKRNGKNINLSRKEFALLEFFLRHPNQTFNAEQLTQQVWDYDSDVLPNTAQVYVGYLRKKIDLTFPDQPKLLQNTRGFGYKLCLPKQG